MTQDLTIPKFGVLSYSSIYNSNISNREQRSSSRSGRGVAIAIATRPFKFREISVSNSTSSFVSSIHSLALHIQYLPVKRWNQILWKTWPCFVVLLCLCFSRMRLKCINTEDHHRVLFMMRVTVIPLSFISAVPIILDDLKSSQSLKNPVLTQGSSTLHLPFQ